MEFFKADKIYNFMGKRNLFIGISLLFIIISYVLLIVKGFNLGIDFSGGTVVQVQYQKKAPIEKIREQLKNNVVFEKASITKFGSDKEIIIKVSNSLNGIQRDVGDIAKEVLSGTGDFNIRRVDMVGPKVGNELREKGLMALVLSILAILVYISFRFEFRFAMASVLALVHDISIAIGFIVLFNIDVNLDILAALLTILGYSLNDTIIVFDRIREGLQDSKSIKLTDVINESVSKTLSRTTLTSLTTLFVVATLFLFGGEIIHGFSFTLLVGIIVGTYSSIFIAASFLVFMKFSVTEFRAKEAKKLKREAERNRMRAMYESGVV